MTEIVPMRMHKNSLIQMIRERPDEHNDLIVGFDTAEDAINALMEAPGEWFIGDELVPPNDPRLEMYGKTNQVSRSNS